MTKKLTALFNLPDDESPFKPDEPTIVEEDITDDELSTLDKITAALPQVRGAEASDNEFDEIAALAINSYKDLMDLTMQVDSRFAAELATAASSMLGHAYSARNAKFNMKLKKIDLQMKKLALEQKINATVKEIESTPVGEFKSLDRNELLKMLSTKST